MTILMIFNHKIVRNANMNKEFALVNVPNIQFITKKIINVKKNILIRYTIYYL